jgi:hypothetical protein
MFLRLLRLALAALQGFVLPVSAAPYVPATDAQVLERLPISPTDPVFRELRTLRAELAARPGNPDLAAKLAGRYFGLAMAEGDPRYIGYAEAALRPWLASNSIPPDLQVVRGQLRQYRHDFAGALDDFAAALRSDASNTEARAWRAAIFMVQARYAEARAECAALAPLASELFSTGCTAYVDATTGKARVGYEKLSAALRKSERASASSRLWNLTRLAEMAQRLGDPAAAERHFREALSLGITDNFLLAAFADFLLDEKRPAEVVSLLKERTRSDTLLLRLALAESALKLPGAANRVRALEDRFAEAGLRGEQLHLQEEARFRLQLKHDPQGALRLAAGNWRMQREPRDAGILLSAALAARDRQAGQPAIDWLAKSGFEDARLRRDAEALKALPK